jgi:hypothetical protein
MENREPYYAKIDGKIIPIDMKEGDTDEQRCPRCGWWSEKVEWVERESLHKILEKFGNRLFVIESSLEYIKELLRGEVTKRK